MGAVNNGFFGVKEWRGNCGPPSIFGFFSASAAAGWGVDNLSLLDV